MTPWPCSSRVTPSRCTAWEPPATWDRITTVDAHTGGEPLRVIVDGFPMPEGETVLERRRSAMQHLDAYRTCLMWEPRGHADMYGCLLMPPVSPEADLSVLFLHNEGFSSMCGHGIIALTTVLVETGMIAGGKSGSEGSCITVRIDTPAGLVTATAVPDGDRVRSVRFLNVPSFVLGLDQQVEVDGLGRVDYDLAFGGAFYAFVEAGGLGLELIPSAVGSLIETGMRIKRAIMGSRAIEHPFEDDLGFLYGTIFTGPALSEGADSRNVCIFADGEVDRSPTGTGVSARAAIHHSRGQLRLHEPLIIESVLGSRFGVSPRQVTSFGPYQAVIPEVEGSAHIIGRQEMLIDPNDPLRHGFLLR